MTILVAIIIRNVDFKQAIGRKLEQVQFLCNGFHFPDVQVHPIDHQIDLWQILQQLLDLGVIVQQILAGVV